MGEVEEAELQIKVQSEQKPGNTTTPDPEITAHTKLNQYLNHGQIWWWFLVSLNIFFLIAGQSTATLLGRFYFDRGGNSKWMATLVQVAGFPILLISLLFPNANFTSKSGGSSISTTKLFSIYLFLGLLVAGDNLLYSWGLDYLPVSTYSLICSTQLAFNAIFSFFLNKQKFTPFILNSLVLLTFSAALLAIHSDSDNSSKFSSTHYAIGFVCTLGASALYALILSLMQFSFQKLIRNDGFGEVLKMQIWTSVVAASVCVLGLFLSGEWRDLKGEMLGFKAGKGSYLNTLIWTAVAWQICSVGVVGLIFVVSSLFSNVISTLALPVVPLLSIGFFHDKMDGIKVMAMLLGLWGFVSYIYQNFLDSSPRTATTINSDSVAAVDRTVTTMNSDFTAAAAADP